MSERVVILRILRLWSITCLLAVAVLVALFWLLTELNTEDPNAALTALLGAALSFLGASLKDLASAVSSNSVDPGSTEAT